MADKMWTYFMHLGDNMWIDTWKPNAIGCYYEELSVDENKRNQNCERLY